MELKAGTRIRSSVCATELMVIQCPEGDLDLRCGGAPVVALGEDASPQEVVGDLSRKYRLVYLTRWIGAGLAPWVWNRVP